MGCCTETVVPDISISRRSYISTAEADLRLGRQFYGRPKIRWLKSVGLSCGAWFHVKHSVPTPGSASVFHVKRVGGCCREPLSAVVRYCHIRGPQRHLLRLSSSQPGHLRLHALTASAAQVPLRDRKCEQDAPLIGVRMSFESMLGTHLGLRAKEYRLPVRARQRLRSSTGRILG